MSQLYIAHIDETNCKIHADDSTIQEIADQFTFRIENYRFHPKCKAGCWDGYIRLVERSGVVPKGLVPNVIDYCAKAGLEVAVDDEFKKFKDVIPYDLPELQLPHEPRDYQIAAVDRILLKKRQIILSPTSSGKSMIMYMLSRILVEQKILIIVPNVSLISQIASDFVDYSKKNEWDVDDNCHFISAGVNKNSDKQIICSTWQSVWKQPQSWFEQFDAVIVDEVHLASADCIVSIMRKCVNAFYRVGMTGTLDGSKTNEMSLIANFGPVHRVASTKQLMDSGIVTRAVVNAIALKYPEETCELMRGLPYDDELKFIITGKKRNNFLANLPKGLNGNSLFLFRFVEHHAVIVRDLMLEKHPDKEIYLVTADTPAEERERIRLRANEVDNMVILSTYALFSTGVSINNLHHVVFASPLKSRVKVLQSIGRSLRKHSSKECAYIWDIIDDLRGDKKQQNYSLGHFLERLDSYKRDQFEVVTKELHF